MRTITILGPKIYDKIVYTLDIDRTTGRFVVEEEIFFRNSYSCEDSNKIEPYSAASPAAATAHISNRKDFMINQLGWKELSDITS